jgi:hypothetical protein
MWSDYFFLFPYITEVLKKIVTIVYEYLNKRIQEMQYPLNNTQTIDNTAKTVSSEETRGESHKGKEIVPENLKEVDGTETETKTETETEPESDDSDNSYDSDETIKPTRVKGRPIVPEDKQANLTSWYTDEDSDSEDEDSTEKPKSDKGKEIVPDSEDDNTEKPERDKGKGKEIMPDSEYGDNTEKLGKGGKIAPQYEEEEWEETGLIWRETWGSSSSSGSGSSSSSSENNGGDRNGYSIPSPSFPSPSLIPAPTRSGGENLEGNDRFDANNKFKMSVSEFKYLDIDMQDYILEIIEALLKYIG